MHERRSRRTGVSRTPTAPEVSASRYHFGWRSADHVGLIEYNVGSHVCWPGGQHLLLAINEIGSIERSQFESVAMRDRVRRACLDAVSAENTAVVIDVVDSGVAFRAADPVLRSVFGGLDVNAVGGAGCRAQETGDTLLQPIFVALQHVRAAVARLNPGAPQRAFAIRIILHNRGLEHLHEGDAHALGDGGNVLQDRHAYPVYRKRSRSVLCACARGEPYL